MTRYLHTQRGTPAVAIGGILILVLVLTQLRVGPHPVGVAVTVLLLLCIAVFHSLTVEVTDTSVRIRFRPGPVGRSFSIPAIQSARVVRNPWYYGWGIRWFPHGWLFNVSGLDAVELTMRDGRTYRIGTDQPGELLVAIATRSEYLENTPD